MELRALGERYEAALRAALAYAAERWQPLALLVSGSIVRGNPGPESDFDIFVLHAAAVRQRVQRRFEGVPAELFVNPPGQIRRYFEQERSDDRGRPSTAHMFATGVAVYDPEGVAARLQDEARALLAARPVVSEQTLTLKRYLAASLLEDALDLAETDAEMCAALLANAVLEAVRYRYWAAGQWQPRVKDFLSDLDTLDPALAEQARAFYRAGTLAERLALARAIVGQSAGATGFFEWESAPEAVVDEPSPDRQE